MFGIHNDIRMYMHMNDESEYYSNRQIHDKAVNIFEDYLIEDCRWNLRNYPLTKSEKRKEKALAAKVDE